MTEDGVLGRVGSLFSFLVNAAVGVGKSLELAMFLSASLTSKAAFLPCTGPRAGLGWRGPGRVCTVSRRPGAVSPTRPFIARRPWIVEGPMTGSDLLGEAADDGMAIPALTLIPGTSRRFSTNSPCCGERFEPFAHGAASSFLSASVGCLKAAMRARALGGDMERESFL